MHYSDYLLIDFTTLIGYELIIAFQLLYIFFQWIFIRQREYLYYMVFMAICMVFGLLKYHHVPLPGINQEFLASQEKYFDKALPMLSYFFYFRFARHFVGITQKLPKLNKHIYTLEWILLIYAICDISLAFSGASIQLREYGFQTIASILFFCTIYFVTSFFRFGDKLGYFVVVGGSVLTLGSVGSMILLIMQQSGAHFNFNPLIFNLSTTIFELLAFTTGLAYKANLMEKEKTRAGEILIEKLSENIRLQEKMNAIRHDAAKELHDEVAGGLSDISIYSELVTRNIATHLDKEQHLLRQIRSKALVMMDSIHDLIWALNPANQTIGDLDIKLTLVSRELLAPVNASWKIEFHHELKQIELEPDSMRRIVSVYRTFLSELAPAGIVGTQIRLDNLTSIDITLRLQTTPDKNKLTDRLLHLINKYKVKIELSDCIVAFNLPITTISD